MPLRSSCHGWLSMIALGLALGCGQRRPDWMIPPALDPSGILQEIMQQADKDASGGLDATERPTIPALESSLEALDSDGDKTLSRAEIAAWLERVKKDAYPQQEAAFVIVSKGEPVADALVKLVPEACMGGTIEPAEGRTDPKGLVFLNIQTRTIPGVRCGLYRLEVTGKRSDGTPILAKYGQNSPLGYAIGGGLPKGWIPPVVVVD